jgi:two-component system, NtrC family, sensor histidine kinase HydH
VRQELDAVPDSTVPERAQIIMLEEAFDRFADASAKLEARYTTLLNETESLRAQIRQKDEEIAQAERLSTLGQMAAALAHEVRNPLGAMKLVLSILRQDVADRPGALELVEQVDRSIASLDHVVSNILHFSKGKPLQLAPLSVSAVLQEIAQGFRDANKNCRIAISLKGNPFILGCEHSLRQVFQNITQNALQAMKSKGNIEISITDLPAENIEIVVRDDGPGIAPDVLQNIFNPFVSGRIEGTGLGLAIVKKIVVQHGGTVSVRNGINNDKGAEFIVKLPRSGTPQKIDKDAGVVPLSKRIESEQVLPGRAGPLSRSKVSRRKARQLETGANLIEQTK